jgi:hypothetical protein
MREYSNKTVARQDLPAREGRARPPQPCRQRAHFRVRRPPFGGRALLPRRRGGINESGNRMAD